MSSVVCLNGELLPESEVRISPFDHGFLYGDGIYETMRTIGGEQIFDIDAHLARLRNSAAIMELPLTWSDDQLKKWAEEVVRRNGFAEARVRISVTRGENHYHFVGAESPTLVISAAELSDYTSCKNGVDLVSVLMERIMPEVKSSSLLPMIIGKQIAEKAKAFDAVYVDQNGMVTEGTVFNILLSRDNKLIGARHETVLPGTAQRMLVAKATAAGFEFVEERFGVSQLQAADEVLITNSLFGCLPVAKVDGKPIADCPGKIFWQCGLDFWN